MSRKHIDGGTMEVGGNPIPIDIVINPRARRLILRLDRDRRVRVTCPSKRHVKDALRMANERRPWIKTQLEETPTPIPFVAGRVLPVLGQQYQIVRAEKARSAARFEGDMIITGGQTEAALARRVETLLRQEVLKICTQKAEEYANALDVHIGSISTRQMTSRWGSCGTNGNICFNWRLVFAPLHVLHYVIAHEVAHRVYMDHSPGFWATVQQLDPHYEKAAQWLKHHGAELYAYGQPSPKDQS
ncbi:MAG: SprT family zinc-dependent metalloprotease [Pseudomonadota bacterium]